MKSKNPVPLREHKILDKKILTRNALKSILLDALIDGDLEILKDVLVTQIHLQNKSNLRRKSKLGRQTLYDITSGRRDFNPRIKTLSSLLKAIVAA